MPALLTRRYGLDVDSVSGSNSVVSYQERAHTPCGSTDQRRPALRILLFLPALAELGRQFEHKVRQLQITAIQTKTRHKCQKYVTISVHPPEFEGWKNVSLLRMTFSRESSALDPPGTPELESESLLIGLSTDIELTMSFENSAFERRHQNLPETPLLCNAHCRSTSFLT